MNQIKNQSINLVKDSASASSLLNPIRIQMLQKLKEPNSASSLSRELHLSRQKINYHLRELEKHKLVELVQENKKGNCIERIMKTTARHYLINFDPLGNLISRQDQINDRFSSTYLIAVASEMIQETALLQEKAEHAKKKLPTLTLQTEVRFSTPEKRSAFTEELTKLVAELTTKYNDDLSKEGRKFKLNLCSYPSPKNSKSN